jgi:hypothetical protein
MEKTTKLVYQQYFSRCSHLRPHRPGAGADNGSQSQSENGQQNKDQNTNDNTASSEGDGEEGSSDSDDDTKYVRISNTSEAYNHYKNGDGEPALLGLSAIDAVLNNDEFKYHHNRIILGLTEKTFGNFGVNIEFALGCFHIGDTRIDYSVSCLGQTCTVTYTFFSQDGFWDVDEVTEFCFSWSSCIGLPFEPDGPGPLYEFNNCTPFPYVPVNMQFNFPNPGGY